MGTPLPIEVANLGMADSLILMVMALVVFGPRRLPQIGRQIGKLMYEFRKASNDFKFQMEEELRVAEEADRRKKDDAERQRAMSVSAPPQSIEAQADIGAVESPIASPYSGEAQYPGTPAAESEPVVTVPRIQPPTIGEQVSVARPTPVVEPLDTDLVPHSSANGTNSAEPSGKSAPERVTEPIVESDTVPTEPVSHHG